MCQLGQISPSTHLRFDIITNTAHLHFQKCLCLYKNIYHTTYDTSLVTIIYVSFQFIFWRESLLKVAKEIMDNLCPFYSVYENQLLIGHILNSD